MKLLRRAGLGLLGLVLLLAAVIAVRAATWKPQAAAVEPVPLARPVAVDADAAARRLGEAIHFQTISNEDPALNRWDQWDGLHAWLRASYPRVHAAMTLRTVAARTLIYAWPGSDPAAAPIVLMAHQDVVPVSPGTERAWARAPFSGEVANGFVYGRGALDDKGSLVAIMEGMETLVAAGFRPRRTVYLVFGHDEEVSGSGAQAAAAWFRGNRIRPEFALDEGGVALTENPITGRPFAFIGVAEKGYLDLKITAEAPGGHSSAPPERTAAHVLAKAVDRIAADPYPLRFDGPGADTVRALAAEGGGLTRALVANDWLFGPLIARRMGADPVSAAMLRTTTAPTMLEGSPKANVLPQRATAVINHRLHPRDRSADVLARARRAVHDLPVKVEAVPGGAEASAVSSTDSAAWRLLSTLARESTGAPVAPYMVGGATDGRHFVGVARDVYRFYPAVVTPRELESFHGTNERLSVENLGRMATFYARLVATAAGPVLSAPAE